MLENKKIALAVTGSIAAYKAAELVSMLTKNGAQVRVLMTAEAQKFITPQTLKTLSRHDVATDMWAERENWVPEHIDLATWGDAFLVVPATAQTIANFAHGFAPDIVSATYLATRVPVLLAPAMNSAMFDHPATQANLEILRSRGNLIITPVAGRLACGTHGNGHLAPLETILEKLENLFL